MAEKKKGKEYKPIPEVNIGIVGHVDHGKTTLTYELTGKFTDEHTEELKRGITIRLGYATTTIYKCPKCGEDAYTRFEKCPICFSETVPVRTISIVDAPGHESLMATVLTGASLMDGAILVIAANEPCPQPQTVEHLEALNISGIRNIIIVQNKIDLVTPEQARKNYEEIKEFVKGTVAENAPVIPVSAQHGVNINYVFKAIQDFIPTPERDEKKPPKMLVARSFDVNKPGTPIEQLKGGVIGGSLLRGVLRKGEEIEILPGILDDNGNWQPIRTKITSIVQGSVPVETARPGGLIALGTMLDPFLTKSDRLSSSVAGRPGELPPLTTDLNLEIVQLERTGILSKEEAAETEIRQNDVLLINVGTQKSVGVCVRPGKNGLVKLKRPVSVEKGEIVALSKQVGGRWRLVGYGTVH